MRGVSKKNKNLGKFFWIDLEMTGLDEIRDRILEVAVRITDLEFQGLGDFHEVVYQPPAVLEGMDEWCRTTHGASGLTAAVAGGKPIEDVEKGLLTFTAQHFTRDERVVLAGNSVGNDRRFIDRYLPEFAKRLHYRMIDVSSWKEVFREKFNIEYKKQNRHRAIGDIEETIAELRHYLTYVKTPNV